jgi:ubiquinone/menaquinone biosynthesis C-methylase UbiE
MTDVNRLVEDHYTQGNLFEQIITEIERTGVSRNSITLKDLAPFDQFHIGGIEVSRQLAKAAGLENNWKVLDVGCGIGGPCRMMAAEFDCMVTGIDLTTEYISTAIKLNDLPGLQMHCNFIRANALELPFENNSFDTVWTQHAQMNIPGKEKFYSEISRVLKKSGVFIYHDIFSIDKKNIYYPVPWADDASQSFLFTLTELRKILEQNHLLLKKNQDYSSQGISFFKSLLEKIGQPGKNQPGLAVIMGSSFPDKIRNMYKNLSEKKVTVASGICEKTS